MFGVEILNWRDEVAALPKLAPRDFAVTMRDTVLLVVDMQYSDASRDFGWGPALRSTHPEVCDYYFGRIEDLVVPNVKALIEAFRAQNGRIVYLTLGPMLPDGSDLTPNRKSTSGAIQAVDNHFGSPEHAILDELAPREGELVVNKTSRGAFNSTAIDQTLRNFGCKSLIVVGVSTSSCVETTARDSADRGYNTVIVEDATAELDKASHDASLRQFAVRWGRVWDTDSVFHELGLSTR